jgi:membrane dipeptidase
MMAATGLAACSPEVRQIKKPLIIDGLGGFGEYGFDTYTESMTERGKADLKASGLTAVNVTLPYVHGPADPYERSVEAINEADQLVADHPDAVLKVSTAADIIKAYETGRCGMIYGFQNAEQLYSASVSVADRIQDFRARGIRVIQLTYNLQNRLGAGSMVPNDAGLTEFGIEAVHALNDQKILVDLSHSGQQTCLDALKVSKTPIAITHSGCASLSDLPRNKTDEELKLLADKGGVLGIYYMPFLRGIGEGQAMAEDVVAHIEYAWNLIGEDHVGIGTDGGTTTFDDFEKYRAKMRGLNQKRIDAGIAAKGEGIDILPLIPDLRGPEKFTKLIHMLEARGHKARKIEKLMGPNFLRLMGQVWGS